MGELANAFRDLDEKRVYTLIDEAIRQGIPPLELIDECKDGMELVGELFSEEEYYISQLMFSAEILKNVMDRLNPLLGEVQKTDSRGKVVIGTVKGDIHDIGKNILITLLPRSGFEVIDLGVDVAAEKFVEALKESRAKVVGLSALLSLTYPEMKHVVDAIGKAGLRDQVKIIIGGSPVNERVRQFAGADYYGEDAVTGVKLCKEIYA